MQKSFGAHILKQKTFMCVTNPFCKFVSSEMKRRSPKNRIQYNTESFTNVTTFIMRYRVTRFGFKANYCLIINCCGIWQRGVSDFLFTSTCKYNTVCQRI